MAYAEAFLYYIAVTLIMFVVIFGGIVFIYWFLGQFKLFASNDGRGNFNFEDQKALLFSLVKHKLFKLTLLFYLATAVFFYIHQSFHYYGKDRAYPQAKTYAIVGNIVLFWKGVLTNIQFKRGFSGRLRLLWPEDPLDNHIQAFQDHLLEKMYQYIPPEDGEREIWYYKYKQLIITKIRWYPIVDTATNKSGDMIFGAGEIKPHFISMMDKMHEVSRNLHTKSIKDKVFEQERYLSVAQMSYYLNWHMDDYATLEDARKFKHKKLKVLMDNPKLFQKQIEYAYFLHEVYKTIVSTPRYAKTIHGHPFSLGLLYHTLERTFSSILSYQTLNNILMCDTPEAKIYTDYFMTTYHWVRDKDSSYRRLQGRNKRQMKSLFSFPHYLENSYYPVLKYICEEPLKIELKSEKNYRKLIAGDKEWLQKQKQMFLKKYKGWEFTMKDFVLVYTLRGHAYINIEKLKELKERGVK